MDGPAVNWTVWELFDEKLESKDLPKTLILVAVASILYMVL